jgi:hypothetical protein
VSEDPSHHPSVQGARAGRPRRYPAAPTRRLWR